MRIYTHDARRHRSAHLKSVDSDLPPLKPGTSWIRFGRETLLYNADDQDEQPAPARQTASRGARYARRQAEVTPEQLHVVVQNGRLFQQRHPDVPVLHDRGRFLLVQLDPAQAVAMRTDAATCYGIMPVAADQVVFEEREATGHVPDPAIAALVASVSRGRLDATLTQLVSFGTRHSTSTGHAAAAAFAGEQLTALGYAITAQDVDVGQGRSRNVVADRPGSGAAPRRVVIVTAHLDSVNAAGGADAPAPGADDNGSGSAGLLEIARVLQHHPHVQDLRFILFGGEEQGLLGSTHYVNALQAEQRQQIEAVINLDMIGSLNGSTTSVLIEGGRASGPLIDALSAAAATYTGLTVETSRHPFASDHVPFIEAGVPAVLTIEGADNANSAIHSADDTLEHIDYDFLVEVVKMSVAFAGAAISRS